MYEDPIVEETRRLRDEYASRFGYDLEAMFRDLQERERVGGREVVAFPPRKPRQAKSEAA